MFTSYVNMPGFNGSCAPFDKQHFKPRICLSDSYGEGATYKNPQLPSTVSTKCDEYCSNNEGVFT